MDTHLGTSVAVLGTVALTLPSLLTTYHRQLNIAPPLTPATISRDLCFTYKVRPRHWLGNTYTLISTSLSLNLGFLRTTFLILGGGITGALSNILENVIRHSPSPRSSSNSLISDIAADVEDIARGAYRWMAGEKTDDGGGVLSGVETLRTLQNISSKMPLIVTLCGSSAAGYALLGAEVYVTVSNIVGHRRKLMQEVRSNHMTREEKEERRDWYLHHVAFGVVRLVAIGGQVGSSWEGDCRTEGSEGSKVAIAHSAHLGGFMFGGTVMWLFGWGQ
ncbi:hypothetical protein HK104_001028 [Borealophlyctis nickersoniae]|nr:hypothetical protein HK104_001028 [Borealophlyctis nickersoniae]